MNRGPRCSLIPFVVAVAAGAALGACGGGSAATTTPTALNRGALVTTTTAASTATSAPGTTVVVQYLHFSPAQLVIKAGETVTWTFADSGIPHTVTFEGFGSPLTTNGTWSHTFPVSGTYAYRCVVHPFMTGTVVVR